MTKTTFTIQHTETGVRAIYAQIDDQGQIICIIAIHEAATEQAAVASIRCTHPELRRRRPQLQAW